MAPELLPQHVQETAESTSFSHFTSLVPSPISVPHPVTSRNFHIKSADNCCESVFNDEQKCIKEDNIFAQNFEGIENVRLAAKSSFYKERYGHGGKGGDFRGDFVGSEVMTAQVSENQDFHD
jgi:hypothetical protein